MTSALRRRGRRHREFPKAVINRCGVRKRRAGCESNRPNSKSTAEVEARRWTPPERVETPRTFWCAQTLCDARRQLASDNNKLWRILRDSRSRREYEFPIHELPGAKQQSNKVYI